MRCITWIFVSGLLALALPSTSVAQHGYAGGGHVGAPAGRGITALGGRAYPAPSVGTASLGTHSPAAPGYTGIRPGSYRSYGGHDRGFRGDGNRGRDSRRSNRGYLFAPYYYPYLDYGFGDPDYGSGFDAPPPPDPDAQAAVMGQNMLGDQINRLSAEVEQLKYAQAPQAPPFVSHEDPPPPQPPVMLVLRTGQQLKVQNYAVMDQTFWDFSTEPARKIPIANIDVAASAKATAAGGGEFPQLENGGERGK